VIENIVESSALVSFARKQADEFDSKSVRPGEVENEVADGWEVVREGKSATRLRRPKKKSALLESRVWTLLYKMGFTYLSDKGGAMVSVSRDGSGPKSQVDAVAIDDEIALIVECKSFEREQKDPGMAEKLARLSSLKKPFADGIRAELGSKPKRHVIAVLFTWDILLTESNYARAQESNVTLFNEHDLMYFEALVQHLGPAARFQFLCETAIGKQISGLEIRVPALQTRMGEYTCYNFSIRPDYLLKIAYVAHRSKARAIDVDAYQRMVSRSRLQKIREYISEEGIFPTNIVVNFEQKKSVRFDIGKQEGNEEGGRFGWLTISPSYGSAWIIDGQHRLYAYSGHSRASTSYINVLAFEGLSDSKQAQLFVDINSEQKRVKRSLLVELNANLKWEAPEEEKRISAIVSKVGLALDEDVDSPFRHRILLADVKPTEIRCISLTSIVSALDKPGMFIVEQKKGITLYGPLFRKDSKASLKRAIKLLIAWFSPIAENASDWWNKGAGDGGGLAMNNGVTVCINVLKSVFEHLRIRNVNLLTMEDYELCSVVTKYANALGQHFAGMSVEARSQFRSLQGIGGQTTGTKECQEALRAQFPEFNPAGLDEWLERKKANTNEEANRIVELIEIELQDLVINILKSKYGPAEEQWFFSGVPKSVRKKVDDRINEADGSTGSREQNFDLIHYREIALHQWPLFAEIIGQGKPNQSKEKRSNWIVEVSLIRNAVKHASRREFISIEQLNQLRAHKDWFDGQLKNLGSARPSE
jgi:DGQHR domain-containing protein